MASFIIHFPLDYQLEYRAPFGESTAGLISGLSPGTQKAGEEL
jgi:hypothetical protein